MGAEGEVAPALGQPLPGGLGPRAGAPWSAQAAAASAGSGGCGDRGTRRVTETERGGQAQGQHRVAPGQYRQRQGGRAPCSPRPRGVPRGAPAARGASGHAQPPGAQSPSRARSLGWRSLVVGALTAGRPLAGGLGLSQGRTPRGAHPPRPLPRTGQARAAPAAPSFFGRQHHPSPRLRQGKKRLLTRRGLWCVGRGGIAKPRGGLSLRKVKLLDGVWKKNFLKKDLNS